MIVILILAVCGALIACGLSMTIFYEDWKTRLFTIQVIGFTMVGASLGVLLGLFVSSVPVTEPECPEGEVMLEPRENPAGAGGCVPYEILKDIAK